MAELRDTFGRRIHYLRISVTDRCNLRCIYCMPEEGVPWKPHSEILSYEEIGMVARVGAGMGINKLRLTGGEPLVRAQLERLVEKLATLETVDDICLTTNGTLLASRASDLAQAGLTRVNVSLDSLRAERYRQITRRGEIGDVFNGIEAAKRAGLDPVKVNMVVMRGVNDDEVVDFARMTRDEGWHVRFIELMPFAEPGGLVPTAEVQRRLESLGALERCRTIRGNGPARYFRFAGAHGSVGFISPMTEHVCSRCNRLRLSSDGKLHPCLLSNSHVDLKAVLRQGAEGGLEQLLAEAAALKQECHGLNEGVPRPEHCMSQIGG